MLRAGPIRRRRISRWEHEAVLEAVQARLDSEPGLDAFAPPGRSSIPSANLGCERRTSQMITLKNVSTEMALHPEPTT